MKRRLTILALTALAVVALGSVVLTVTPPVHAGGPPDHPRGATQISGVAYPDPDDTCVAASQNADFNNIMTGDLVGCLYVVVDVENTQCINTGNGGSIYHERGTETFVGEYDGNVGTFGTTYLFTSKWSKPCVGGFPDPTAEEIFGRCQHPIVAGSGTGDFIGVTGRLDLKDDIAAGNFPYKGHLKW
jgi:hypothetical protein